MILNKNTGPSTIALGIVQKHWDAQLRCVFLLLPCWMSIAGPQLKVNSWHLKLSAQAITNFLTRLQTRMQLQVKVADSMIALDKRLLDNSKRFYRPLLRRHSILVKRTLS